MQEKHGVRKDAEDIFYPDYIQSVLTFSFICRFGNVSQKDKNKLQRVVNISSKITGFKQSSVTALYEKQVKPIK